MALTSFIARQSALVIMGTCGLLAEASEEAAPGSAAMPPVGVIVRRVLDQPANDPAREHSFDARYESVRTRTFEIRDGDGTVLRHDLKRAVLGPARAGASSEESVVATDTKGRKSRSYQRRDFQVNEHLVSRFDFTLAGREDIAGRPAWIIDFRPKADPPAAKDLKDRFLNATAGRVWVDADESVMVQATLRLIEPVNLLGGLVGSVKRCETRIERARAEAGVYYTRLLDWRLEGRKVLAQRAMHFHEERTDVRPAD